MFAKCNNSRDDEKLRIENDNQQRSRLDLTQGRRGSGSESWLLNHRAGQYNGSNTHSSCNLYCDLLTGNIWAFWLYFDWPCNKSILYHSTARCLSTCLSTCGEHGNHDDWMWALILSVLVKETDWATKLWTVPLEWICCSRQVKLAVLLVLRWERGAPDSRERQLQHNRDTCRGNIQQG